MQRRRFIPLAAVALAGCVGPSDGSGPRNPPNSPEGGEPTESRALRIRDMVPREGEDGALVIAITVENTADGGRSDTLVAVATVDSGEESTEYETSREVSLDGNEQREIELVFEVAYEDWAGNGSLTYGWEDEF